MSPSLPSSRKRKRTPSFRLGREGGDLRGVPDGFAGRRDERSLKMKRRAKD